MTHPNFSFDARLDPRFADLVWSVFFSERGRGLSIDQHFPWLGHDSRARYACLHDGVEIVAGLCVRAVEWSHVAAIGLVCVPPAKRGKGIGRQLLELTIGQMDMEGMAALTLWTGKPDVYRKQGFEIDDKASILHVGTWPTSQSRPIAQTIAAMDRGLPPYALSAVRVRSDAAEALLLNDRLGVAVAEWQGDDDAVIDLLAAHAALPCRIHVLSTDSLPTRLNERRGHFHTEAGALQMWRQHPTLPPAFHPSIRLLDRI